MSTPKKTEADAKFDARRADQERASAEAAAAQAAAARAPRPQGGWLLEHDGLVSVVAAILLLVGYVSYSQMTRQKSATFDRHGLTFSYPAGWFPNDPAPEAFPVAVSFAAIEPTTRVEVRITKKPAFDGPIESVLEVSRSRQYGELYKKLTSSTHNVGGKDWLRTDFVYAFKKQEDDSPRIAAGVEYAAMNNENLYVVTIHGPEDHVKGLERDVLGTLALK